ncbi:hypothetical protein [Rhizobium sp. JAB6]|uniref:hypothetical protein n=1 Tax=Rhizobium sp. JAB6 TaxID=2127050 RepID=UPI0011B27D6E|nr:hypothetical protein [Rhizobium sp. JAB6]
MKKEIGWSFGSGSVRCFGEECLAFPAGVMPFWDKEVCRAFGRRTKSSSTFEADVGAHWLGLV